MESVTDIQKPLHQQQHTEWTNIQVGYAFDFEFETDPTQNT